MFSVQIKGLILNTNFYYLLLGMSIILWILTISQLTVVEMSNPFYLISILPIHYWLGISILLMIIIIRQRINKFSYLDFILLILVCLYLYGTFSILYENPRFMDVYMHSGFALNIFNKAHVTGGKYIEENPLSFIWFVSLKSVTHLSDFLLLKLLAILIPLIIGSIFYCMFNNKYSSLISAISFLGLFFIDQGHFSPQALALIYILIIIYVWLSQYKRVRSKRALDIHFSLIFILGVSLIIFTNLTSTLALIVIIFFYIISYYSDSILKIKVFNIHKVSAIPSIIIILLTIILFITWLLFIGQRSMNDILFRVNDLIVNLSTLSKVAIKTGVADLYLFFNLLQYISALSVISSGLLLIYFYRRNLGTIGPLVFLVFLSLLPITFFQLGEKTSTFLQRTYMYLLIGWSIIIGTIFVKLTSIFKYLIMSIIIFSILILPITRYGGDFANYVPSSLFYVTNSLIKYSVSDSIIITSSASLKHPFIYTYHKSNNYKNDIALHSLGYYNYKEEGILYKINHILAREINKLTTANIFIVIAERDIYKYSLIHNDSHFIDNITEELNNIYDSNKIIDSTYQKIYNKNIT